MSTNLISRFFGSGLPSDQSEQGLVANPKIEKPLSLQLLFAESPLPNFRQIILSFGSFHESMAQVRGEFEPSMGRDGTVFGMIGWQNHVVRFVGFNLPMPANDVERCVSPSNWDDSFKNKARAHQAHLMLSYVGYEESAHEQYVALAAVAGALHQFGAPMALNSDATNCCPTLVFAQPASGRDNIQFLRQMPLTLLYCCFVKYVVEGFQGVWMRSYGGPVLGLPDLVVHANGAHEGERYLFMFNSILGHLLQSGTQLGIGDTMQIGENQIIRFRAPSESELFLQGDPNLLVIEATEPS
jgi:Domain of unknown function (DUF4261)